MNNISQQLSQLNIVLSKQMNETNKMDILFHKSYLNLKFSYKLAMFYHALKACMVIILLPIDLILLKAPFTSITIFMILAIVVNVGFFFTLLIFYHCAVDNNRQALDIAINSNHSVIEPDSYDPIVSSKVYNAQTETLLGSEGLTEQIMKRYESIMESFIDQNIKSRNQWGDCLQNICKFSSFALFIFGIIALSTNSANTPELVVLIIFLVLEGLQHFMVILILIVVALSPLICILICCLLCCCGVKGGQNVIPPPESATIAMINEAGKDCPICFQSFKVQEKVVVLPCSTKHMFHSLCISGWAQVSPTCPICRHRLTGSAQFHE